MISQKEYDKSRMEYGNIVKGYAILKDTNEAVDEVWNDYIKKRVPNLGIKNMVAEKQRGCCQTAKKFSRKAARKEK